MYYKVITSISKHTWHKMYNICKNSHWLKTKILITKVIFYKARLYQQTIKAPTIIYLNNFKDHQ
jgi:hypothetical protein